MAAKCGKGDGAISLLRYHHCMDLEDVSYKEIVPSAVHSYRKLREEYRDHDDRPADSLSDIVEWEIVPNWWLEGQVGFYPLFMAVGDTEDDIEMTGYQNQWGRVVSSRGCPCRRRGWANVLRKAGDFPNRVLFSYAEPPSQALRYVDYDGLFLVLNSSHCDYKMTDRERRIIFKPSWRPSDWLRMAKRKPHHVMAVTDRLDLRRADRIWVRNKKTAKALRDMGFRNVSVKRIPVSRLGY